MIIDSNSYQNQSSKIYIRALGSFPFYRHKPGKILIFYAYIMTAQ